MLATQQLRIAFYDQNNHLKSDEALGTGVASIRNLCERLGSVVRIKFPISDKTGAVTGEGVLGAVLRKGDASQMNDALPESAVTVEKGVLRIVSIAAFDLGGGDQSLLDNKPVSRVSYHPWLTF